MSFQVAPVKSTGAGALILQDFLSRLKRGDPSLFFSPWIQLLTPVSHLYGKVAAWRRRRLERRSVSLGLPVVSIGNITTGGTGKTPLVEMVVRDLVDLGRHPAVLSRGYGRRRQLPESALASEGTGVNDEFLVLERILPGLLHFQHSDRVRGGRAAIEKGADVLVLDDGFQHVLVRRNLDLVLIDAIHPFGFGRVLPAGLLREPLQALEKADALVLTRCRQVGREKAELLRVYLRGRFPRSGQIEVDFEPQCWLPPAGDQREPLETLKSRRVLGFAGIGNPEAFRRQLLSLGLAIVEWIPFPDHYGYTQIDVERIGNRARSVQADTVVLTEKDAVKIVPHRLPEDMPWRYLRIRPRLVSGSRVYRELLMRALQGSPERAS